MGPKLGEMNRMPRESSATSWFVDPFDPGSPQKKDQNPPRSRCNQVQEDLQVAQELVHRPAAPPANRGQEQRAASRRVRKGFFECAATLETGFYLDTGSHPILGGHTHVGPALCNSG